MLIKRPLLPEPSPMPLSRQVENVLLVVLVVGLLCTLPSLLLGSRTAWVQELLVVGTACMITILGPLLYSVIQGIRWLLQDERV